MQLQRDIRGCAALTARAGKRAALKRERAYQRTKNNKHAATWSRQRERQPLAASYSRGHSWASKNEVSIL